VGRGGTLLPFAAIPLAAGLPFPGRAGMLHMRYVVIGVVLWYATVMYNAANMSAPPPMVGLIPLMAAAISVWTAISVQANAALKRVRSSGPS
jgi:hypothetical protein